MSLRILIAPSGFKESLSAEEVADCIEAGIRRVMPDCSITKAPQADGGEGFAEALAKTTGGTLHDVEVTGPTGQPVKSYFGFLGGDGPRTAVMEMAAAAGLRLVPANARDPLLTTTYGVGELLRAALDAGAERILFGCGDSGTNDGGAGLAQALGVKLLDDAGHEIGRGGGALANLAKIDLSGRDPRLEKVQIDVACNWHNVLCGEKGVARVFGPQKGASPETVEKLERALERFAEVIERDLGLDVRTAPGCGASGGVGAGLSALLGAKLHPRFEIIMQYMDLDALLAEADLVFTAEGGLDFQTPKGKVPSEVAHRAKKHDLPVIALAGTLGRRASVNYAEGIDAMLSVLERPTDLPGAVADAANLVTNAAENAMRTVQIGQRLAGK
jgi:glycerate 2-kinase